MKKFCVYFLPLMLAISFLPSCGQKQVVPMPGSHIPPASVPQIGGPTRNPDQNQNLDQGQVQDQSGTTSPAQGQAETPALTAVQEMDIPPESQTPVPQIGGPARNDDSDAGQTVAALIPESRQRPKALTRMIERAQSQLAENKPEQAFSTMEQALYIDGQDPLVWHLMAKAQLAQGHFQQAVSLAKKSGSLCASYPELKEKNNDLIQQAQGK